MPERARPRPRLDRRWLTALAGLAMLLAVVVWGIPWLTKSRQDTTSTPTPPPFAAVAPIALKPGAVACEDQVAYSTDTRAAVLLTAPFEGPGSALRVVASYPGYEGVAVIDGSYGGSQALRAELPAPPRNALGTFCVENTGRRTIQLSGTTEGRIQNRSTTSVDDEVVPEKMALILTEAVNRSLADRPGEILDRIAAFKPFWVGSFSLALLALVIALGVPAAVLWAVWWGVADED